MFFRIVVCFIFFSFFVVEFGGIPPENVYYLTSPYPLKAADKEAKLGELGELERKLYFIPFDFVSSSRL